MPSPVDRIKLTRAQDRRAKATDEEVAEMRSLYARGTTQKAIAEMFNISKSAVSYIVSDKSHEHLREYRQINKPKKRTKEESALYSRELRKYKKEILKHMQVKHKHQPIMSEERKCSGCIHAHRIDENTLECDAKVFDIKFLTCFVSRSRHAVEVIK